MTERFANNAISTLALGVTSGSTFIQVTSNAPFPTSPTFRVRVDDEIMVVTAVAGAVFSVTRGAEGTVAASHTAGATVTHVLTAGALQQMASDVAASLNVQASAWGARTDWYVHPGTGNDANDGASTLTPLKTFGELSRRLGAAPKHIPLGQVNLADPWARVNVWVMASSTERPRFNDCPAESYILVRAHDSAITQLGTGTITAFQAADASAGGTTAGTGNLTELEASAMVGTWTSNGFVNKAVRITNPLSPAYGAVAMVSHDLGGGNKRARLTRFAKVDTIIYGTFVNPQVGDTFEVIELPSLPTTAYNAPSYTAFYVGTHLCRQLGDWDYNAGDMIGSYGTFVSCAFPPPSGGGTTNIVQGANVTMYGCLTYSPGPDGTYFDLWQGSTLALYGCAHVGIYNTFYVYGEMTRVVISRETFFAEGAQIYGTDNSRISIDASDFGVFDSTWETFDIGVDCLVTVIDYGASTHRGYVFGTGNTKPIFKMRSFSKGVYSDKARMKATFTVGKPLMFGATAKDFVDLPFVNTATAADNQAAFVQQA